MSECIDITVIMPNYNHAHFLPESLGAIFSQSRVPKEVIIIDDASKDESVSVIQRFLTQYSQIKLIRNSVNQGPVVSLNKALKEAKGKYLAFCSADDIVLPGLFEEGSKWLDQFPQAGICSSNPSFFKNQSPYHFRKMVVSNAPSAVLIDADQIPFKFLLSPLWIPSHASLFRKEAVLQAGGFPEGLRHLSDWYLNIRISMTCGIVHAPQSFGAFRTSDQSYGAVLNRSYKKKIPIYTELFRLLSVESRSFQKAFCRSGVLGQISSDLLLYLLPRPSLWKYLPFALLKKICNFFRKIKREIAWAKSRGS